MELDVGDKVEVCIEVPSSWLAPAKCKIASDRIADRTV